MPDMTRIYIEKGRSFEINKIWNKVTVGMEMKLSEEEQTKEIRDGIKVKLANTVDAELDRQCEEIVRDLT